jgi:sec-independent protein translocase protein TatC
LKNPFKAGDPAREMSFLEHLEALRWHLVRSVGAVVALAVLAFVKKDIVFDAVLFGPRHADFPTYRWLCALSERVRIDLCIDDFSFNLISVAMAGQFTTHVWVSFLAGVILAFPYIVWELWRFVKPALTASESRHARGAVFFISILFFSGVLFGYYLIAPLSIHFLGSYQVSETVSNQINLASYISTIAFLTFATGLVFELPAVVYFLSRVGLVTPRFMRAYRRHAMVAILVVAAVITPSPDVSSQLLVALPLFGLYELSIFVSAYVQRGR